MGSKHSTEPQKGRTVIVTGASSGIGYHTALELGKQGAHVICLARDEKRGQAALEKMKEQVPEGKYELEICDLADLSSVKEFTDRFKKRNIGLHTLVNNAGIMMPPERQLSKDGFEMQWATNHLGHFALTGQLLESMKGTYNPRVVNVTSILLWQGKLRQGVPIDFCPSPEAYSAYFTYCSTKQANLIYSRELAKRHGWIKVTAAHPGVVSSGLQKYAFSSLTPLMPNASWGAAQSLRAITDADAFTGSFFGPFFVVAGKPVRSWIPTRCNNNTLGTELWNASVKATKVEY